MVARQCGECALCCKLMGVPEVKETAQVVPARQAASRGVWDLCRSPAAVPRIQLPLAVGL